MHEVKISEADLKAYLMTKFPYTVIDGEAHASRIRWKGDDYDTVVKWIESNR